MESPVGVQSWQGPRVCSTLIWGGIEAYDDQVAAAILKTSIAEVVQLLMAVLSTETTGVLDLANSRRAVGKWEPGLPSTAHCVSSKLARMAAACQISGGVKTHDTYDTFPLLRPTSSYVCGLKC